MYCWCRMTSSRLPSRPRWPLMRVVQGYARAVARMVSVMVGVDQVGHLVAHAVGSGHLVDCSLEVVPDARRGIEKDDAVPRRQEGGLIDAIRDPVQVPLDASQVVALRVGGRPEG